MSRINFASFFQSIWGIMSAPSFLLFPLSGRIFAIVPLPVADPDKITTWCVLACLFALLFTYVIVSQGRSVIGLAGVYALLVVACYLIYQVITAPVLTLTSLGLDIQVVQQYGYPASVIVPVYIGIFAGLTGAFTSLTAWIYQRRAY